MTESQEELLGKNAPSNNQSTSVIGTFPSTLLSTPTQASGALVRPVRQTYLPALTRAHLAPYGRIAA